MCAYLSFYSPWSNPVESCQTNLQRRLLAREGTKMNGKQFFKRVLKLLIRRGLIALLLLSLVLGSGKTANAQDANTPGQTLTVTNVSEDINGDISSPAALLANPGADGISLPEALTAVEADTGVHETINFDPSLGGSVINLTQTLPPITRDGLTLDGDSDDDGIPDITLDGGGSNPNALQIYASDVVVEGLHFRDFPTSGIEIRTIPELDVHLVENLSLRHNALTNTGESAIVISNNLDHAVIRNIEISDNTLQNYRFGIKLHAGFALGANDNEISNVSILSNTLLASGPSVGIFISPLGLADISRNTIRDIQIRGNTISGHTNSSILIDAANQANCSDNLVSDITIAENQIDGTPVTIEMISVGESGANAARNVLSNVTITDNILSGGGIQFGGATGYHSHDNTVSEVLIDRNHISSCAANGISFYAGAGGSHDNLLENVILRNTLVDNCHDAGVLLHGDYGSSTRNVINNVAIANLTLVNNGIESGWAGGLNINTLDSSNTITGVTVANTILWQNGGGDAILGSLAPASVIASRLSDSRFTGDNDNFSLSPGFVDPASGDYHLQPTSPCIDSGDPTATNVGTLDLDKHSRLWDGNGDGLAVVDRGAYEINITVTPEIQDQDSGSPSPTVISCLAVGGMVLILGLLSLRKKR
jgi:hypothetical protein